MYEPIAINEDVESLLEEWRWLEKYTSTDPFEQAIMEHEKAVKEKPIETLTKHVDAVTTGINNKMAQNTPVLEVVAETPKAYLLKDLEGKFWVPKSWMEPTDSGLIVPEKFIRDYIVEEKIKEISGDVTDF